ncbi:hypothetical protein AB0K21_43760 [Streptosporangium sp. NPDC049248]|uniref:hypothetical protein n=1 Tax=Streptosporangium sp. NPDC049248 TaxID=3155651 RepID=UPI00343EF582
MTTPPPRPGMLTYSGEVMACPLCGDGDGTHIEHAYVAARREDREFTNVHVNGITGEVAATPEEVSVPTGGAVGEGRRQRLALTGWCEMCGGEYAIVFTQHKGATYMETVQINEGPIYRTGRTDWR